MLPGNWLLLLKAGQKGGAPKCVVRNVHLFLNLRSKLHVLQSNVGRDEF